MIDYFKNWWDSHFEETGIISWIGATVTAYHEILVAFLGFAVMGSISIYKAILHSKKERLLRSQEAEKLKQEKLNTALLEAQLKEAKNSNQ